MKNVATSWFGAVMGLAGLGLACRGAAGVVPQPAAFAEIWVFAGALALAVLLPVYVFKLFTDLKDIAEEFGDPARFGYCATLPLALTLVAGGLQTHAPRLANGLWLVGAVLLIAFQVFALRRWLAGGIDLAKVNGGWMIMLIGGIVVPGAGVPLGHPDLARFCFGVSTALAPLVMAIVLYRTVAGPVIADAGRPAWFIFLVPPSLIYVNGLTLWGPLFAPALDILFYAALVLAAALLLASWRFLGWPFSSLWWAFTFPLDALAIATAHYARAHPGGPWAKIAAAALAIAVLFIVIALYKSLRAPWSEPAE